MVVQRLLASTCNVSTLGPWASRWGQCKNGPMLQCLRNNGWKKRQQHTIDQTHLVKCTYKRINMQEQNWESTKDEKMYKMNKSEM